MSYLKTLENGLKGNNLRDVFRLYLRSLLLLAPIAIFISLIWGSEVLFTITPVLVILLVACQYVSIYYRDKVKYVSGGSSRDYTSFYSLSSAHKYELEHYKMHRELDKAYRVDRAKVRYREGSGCFIATAAYSSPIAPEVMLFRQFRDKVLLSSKVGKVLIVLYYFVSPPLAKLITKVPLLKVIVRSCLLNPLIRYLKGKIKPRNT